MDDLGGRIKQITNELKQYVETRLELMVLNFSDKITYIIGQSVQQLIGYSILTIGVLFALVALAIYLSELIGEEWAGYLIVAAPLVLIGLIVVIAKPKAIVRGIQNQILSELIDTMNEPDETIKKLPANELEQKKKTTKPNG